MTGKIRHQCGVRTIFFYQRKCLRNKNVCRRATRYWGCIPDRIINRNTLMALIFVRWKGAIITFESIEAVVREWTVLFRLIIPGHSHLSNYWLWRFRFKNHLSMRWCCSSFLLPSLINANVEKILHVLEPFNSSWPNYVLIPGIFFQAKRHWVSNLIIENTEDCASYEFGVCIFQSFFTGVGARTNSIKLYYYISS